MFSAGTGSKVEQVKCMSCGGKGFGQCIGENDMGVEVTCKKHYKSCMTKRYGKHSSVSLLTKRQYSIAAPPFLAILVSFFTC